MIISLKHISAFLPKSSVAKKLGFNLISQGSIFTGKWLFNFTLAKLLSPGAFGIFTLIQAFGNFLMNVISFGASSHLIHSISENQKSAYFKLQKSINLSFKISLAITCLWLFLVVSKAEIDYLNYFGWSILLGSILSFNAQIFAFFKGLSQFQKEAKAGLIFSAGSILVVTSFWSFGIIQNTNLLLAIFSGLQCILFFRGIHNVRHWFKTQTKGLHASAHSFLKERLPFGLHEIQGALYIHVILLILGFMVPEEELGMYRAVQLFITPVSLLPGVVSQVTLNKLSSLKHKPQEQLTVFRKFLKLISFSGAILFLIYALFGGSFINWIYDYKYDVSTVNFLIICFSSAFMLRFISSNYGVVITSAGKQSIRVLMTFLSILVSITLTYVLTNSMGVKGAALAAVSSFGVIALGYASYCEMILFKKLRKNASNNFRT